MAKRKAEMAFMPSTPRRAQPSLETSSPMTNKKPGTPNRAGMSPKPSTPKRIVLSIEEKRGVLKRFDALPPNMSQEGAAKMLQIPRMTLRNFLKNRDEIMSAPNSAKKRCRAGKDEQVEEALIKWFHAVREKNANICQEFLLEKSEDLAKKLGHDDFKPSRGWLYRLCKRSDIKFKKLRGEAASSDVEARDNWLTDVWPQFRDKYEPCDIWNTDETGLYYRMMPDGTLAFANDKRKGGKKSKERVTVLFTASMTGEKKRPLMIGKSFQPRCLKNIKTYPVDYKSQNSSWMTSQLYAQFLTQWDEHLRARKRKILLLHDNCPAHKVDHLVSLTNIELLFLPANTTAILQPMDQGIIATVKRHYKKAMSRKILEEIDKSGNTASAGMIAKKITLLTAMEFVRNSWDSVSENTIQNCFKKGKLEPWHGIGCEFENEEEEDNEVTFRLPYPPELIKQWIEFDKDLETSAPTTEDDIIDEIKEKEKPEEMEDEASDDEIEEIDSVEEKPVSSADFSLKMTQVTTK